MESQDQKVNYEPELVNIKGCGYYFPMPVPADAVLCAMKVSAMFDRKKGRDFYDAMFLLSQTLPDFNFLKEKSGISNLRQLTWIIHKKSKKEGKRLGYLIDILYLWGIKNKKTSPWTKIQIITTIKRNFSQNPA